MCGVIPELSCLIAELEGYRDELPTKMDQILFSIPRLAFCVDFENTVMVASPFLPPPGSIPPSDLILHCRGRHALAVADRCGYPTPPCTMTRIPDP
ncbi:hypothetical protein IG631_17019 [Alternaria alternata]|nr:hypothetical protein IG631_17019 [Alternaria alternata]